MADKAQPTDAVPSEEAQVAPPKRSPGHRGADMRDTVAEMAARAHEISQEAGSKMATAMKDVINAAAGLAGFAVESARDLVQYMVRRGQMTQEEADKLLREAEDAYAKRKPVAAPSANGDAPARGEPAARHDAARREAARHEAGRAEVVKGEAPKAEPARKKAEPAKESAPAARKAAAKPAAKAPAKPAAKSATKAPAKVAAKAPAKSAAKPAAKAPAKKAAAKRK